MLVCAIIHEWSRMRLTIMAAFLQDRTPTRLYTHSEPRTIRLQRHRKRESEPFRYTNNFADAWLLQFAWLQDVPRRPSHKPEPKPNPEDFPSIMQRVLEALNIRPALQAMIMQDVRVVLSRPFPFFSPLSALALPN